MLHGMVVFKRHDERKDDSDRPPDPESPRIYRRFGRQLAASRCNRGAVHGGRRTGQRNI